MQELAGGVDVECNRSIDGLWMRRIVTCDTKGFHWTERPHPRGGYGSTPSMTARLRAVRRILPPSVSAWLQLPALDAWQSARELRYPVIKGALLWDELRSKSFLQLYPFGAMLGALHNTVLSGPRCNALGQLTPFNKLTLRAVEGKAGVHAAFVMCAVRRREALSMRLDTAVAALATETRTLVHGRWSGGVLYKGEASNAALGGPDFFYGPAEYDLGYLTAELLEAAASEVVGSGRRATDRAMIGVRQFIEGYRAVRPFNSALASAFVIYRLAGHLVAHDYWCDREGLQPAAEIEVEGLLAIVEYLLPEIDTCML